MQFLASIAGPARARVSNPEVLGFIVATALALSLSACEVINPPPPEEGGGAAPGTIPPGSGSALPGTQPSAQPGTPGAQPGGQPANPGAQPGEQPGAQPGEQPGAQPGEQPGAQPGGQPGGQPANPGADPAERGAALYAQYCSVCHGPTGEGTNISPESIQSATEMTMVVRFGRGAMPANAVLTDDDILAIEAFLAALLEGPPPQPPADAPPPAPLSGRDYYALQCSACHGANAEGTALGPQMRNPSVPYATWVIRNGRSGVGFPEAMPGYDREQLSEAILDEMMDWLGEFPPPQDGAGLYRTYCANCHGPTGGDGPTRAAIDDEDLGDFMEAVREGEGGRSYGDRGDYMPRWSRLEISDGQVQLMWRYVMNNGGGGDPDSDEDSDEGSDEGD